jgi:hypothetical protein
MNQPHLPGARSKKMKLYVDDVRQPPPGWELAQTAQQAISMLSCHAVTELSLDYDLGDPAYGTGLTILDWLAQALTEGRVLLPVLSAHSGSVVGRRRLEAQISLIQQRFVGK